MFRHCGKWFVILALVCTIGGHWAILQSVAWMGMVANYCETEDVATALVKTFDGKNPCRLCKFVSEGKQSERESGQDFSVQKLDVIAQAITSFYFPSLPPGTHRLPAILFQRHDAPPTPPPLLT